MLMKTLSTALTLTAVLLGSAYLLAQEGWHDAAQAAAELPGPKATYSVGDQAEILQSVSGLGALARCAHEGWYQSEIFQDTMMRTVTIFRSQGPGTFVEHFATMFNVSAQSAAYRIAVISPDRTKIVDATTAEVKDEASCKAVEADLIRFRQPGGVLDVKPAPAPGQDA